MSPYRTRAINSLRRRRFTLRPPDLVISPMNVPQTHAVGELILDAIAVIDLFRGLEIGHVTEPESSPSLHFVFVPTCVYRTLIFRPQHVFLGFGLPRPQVTRLDVVDDLRIVAD